jgi:hypothetical protein
VIAAHLAKKYRAPWVADYRDLWTLNRMYSKTEWRRMLDRRWERKLLQSAFCAVTISQVMANELQQEFSVAAKSIPNGYDSVQTPAIGSRTPLSSARLNTLYVGNAFYEGLRSPELLLRAAKGLGLNPSDIRFHFLGSDQAAVQVVAPSLESVADLVEFHPTVDRAECLQWQARSDLLLLLMSSDGGEAGTMTGKIYEYIAVRRPILLLGSGGSTAAELVRARGLGTIASSEAEASDALVKYLSRKPDSQILPDMPTSGLNGLSREDRNLEYERLLQDIVGAGRLEGTEQEGPY